MVEHQPHPENVVGDFYVEDGCCAMCRAPFIGAPALFGVCRSGGYDHCYVKQQPGTAEQVEQMVFAISCAELGCIRYRGTDRLVQLQIAQMGMGDACDSLPDDVRLIN